jgi:hypothetical protein
VDVLSDDNAPEDGTIVLNVAGAPFDRRRVAQGDPLTYNLLAPCEVALEARYVRDDAQDSPVTLAPEGAWYVTGSGERSADLRLSFGG